MGLNLTNDHQVIIVHLQRAIECNEFEVYYQPQINIMTKEVSGIEALIRWKHPYFGWIPPLHFIPIAEETGDIIQIGKMVLKKACQQIHELHELGYKKLKLAVNISPNQIEQPDFLETVQNILIEENFNPRNLEFEITEHAVMKPSRSGLEMIHALKEMGIHFAVDDFGTGFSSLSNLQLFPFDTLKIDKSFLHDINEDSVNTALVESMITLAKKLKIRLVAEGVETVEQLNFLKQSQCHEVQGYIFAKPMPFTQLMVYLLEKTNERTFQSLFPI
ncbi:EAL domain-containing protein [Tepidibacillus marianensis]|uniref:putative bifunctional diguanylate cyclase/phosphodiesterase n=1 Tax=Tepidibacillus marianensis TaxID=3131995 RepID=UPI0030D5C230